MEGSPNSDDRVPGRVRNGKIPGEEAMCRQRRRLERCSHKPRNAQSHGKLDEARKDPPPEPREGVWLT